MEYINGLEKMLKCSYYDIDDGYFFTPDFGCKYDNESNKLGNNLTFLIPINSFRINKLTDIQIEMLIKKVNSATISELKNNFSIYFALIDKAFLNKVKNGETTYYPNFPYILKFICFNKTQKNWQIIKKYNISKIIDEQNAYNDINKFIKNKAIANNKFKQ